MSDALVKALTREAAELDRLRDMKANAERRVADLGPRIEKQEELVRFLNSDPRIPADKRLDLDDTTTASRESEPQAAPDPVDSDPATDPEWEYPQPEGARPDPDDGEATGYTEFPAKSTGKRGSTSSRLSG